MDRNGNRNTTKAETETCFSLLFFFCFAGRACRRSYSRARTAPLVMASSSPSTSSLTGQDPPHPLVRALSGANLRSAGMREADLRAKRGAASLLHQQQQQHDSGRASLPPLRFVPKSNAAACKVAGLYAGTTPPVDGRGAAIRMSSASLPGGSPAKEMSRNVRVRPRDDDAEDIAYGQSGEDDKTGENKGYGSRQPDQSWRYRRVADIVGPDAGESGSSSRSSIPVADEYGKDRDERDGNDDDDEVVSSRKEIKEHSRRFRRSKESKS